MKRLKIDFNQCCGCKRCEVACSLNHFEDSVNPKKSRIRIYEEEDVFYPVVAGPFNNAECTSKNRVVIEDRDYDMCVICRASCPEKPFFIEAGTGIPLKCDFCGIPPNPSCVRTCNTGALELEEDEQYR